MFKNELLSRCEAIFGFKKTTYLAKSDKFEQDTLFIDIENVRSRVSGADGGRTVAKVLGSLVVYSQDDRFPYGYMTKRIQNAPFALTRDFFLFAFDEDIQDSPARVQNLHERRTRFIFFFNSQYDPEKGELNEVTFSLDEEG